MEEEEDDEGDKPPPGRLAPRAGDDEKQEGDREDHHGYGVWPAGCIHLNLLHEHYVDEEGGDAEGKREVDDGATKDGVDGHGKVPSPGK